MITHESEYSFEVHVVGYGETSFGRIPEPFFVNQVVPPHEFTAIATAEFQSFPEAIAAFENVRAWCESQEQFRQYGCRITLEHVLSTADLTGEVPSFVAPEQVRWEYSESAFISFSDVHADGTWDERLKQALIEERGYIPLDYVSRRSQQFLVLTLHFLSPQDAVQEAAYLQGLLRNGFTGTLSVETTVAVTVIGPPNTRRVII